MKLPHVKPLESPNPFHLDRLPRDVVDLPRLLVDEMVGSRDFSSLLTAYEAFEAIVNRTIDVTKADVDRARDLAGRHKRLSSRDCLHIAVMRRMGCDRIWSFDTGFDRAAGVVRIS